MPIQSILIVIALILVVYILFTIGLPFLLAYLLALLLEPFVLFIINKFKVKRIYASLIVCSVFTVIFIALGYLLVYKVASEVIALSSAMLSFLQEITQGIGVLGERYQNLVRTMPIEYQDAALQFTATLFESLKGLIEPVAGLFFNLAKKIPSIFLEFVITFIALFFLSMHLPQNKESFMKLFDPSVHKRVDTLMKNLLQAVFGYLRAQFIISTCIFLFLLIGFLLIGLKYPSATALLITIVDVLPILGAGTVILPMSVYYLFTGNTFLALALLVLYGLITILRRIIEPKVLGDAIGLSPLSVLISMYIGIVLTGVIGVFLGPAVIILVQALRKIGLINIKIKF